MPNDTINADRMMDARASRTFCFPTPLKLALVPPAHPVLSLHVSLGHLYPVIDKTTSPQPRMIIPRVIPGLSSEPLPIRPPPP